MDFEATNHAIVEKVGFIQFRDGQQTKLYKVRVKTGVLKWLRCTISIKVVFFFSMFPSSISPVLSSIADR
jgi:hypothetical protein